MLRVVFITLLNSGLRVARQPAHIPMPGSIIDHVPIVMASEKKWGPDLMPGMYAIRIREDILPIAPSMSNTPAETFADRGIRAAQTTWSGKKTYYNRKISLCISESPKIYSQSNR